MLDQVRIWFRPGPDLLHFLLPCLFPPQELLNLDVHTKIDSSLEKKTTGKTERDRNKTTTKNPRYHLPGSHPAG